MLRNQSSTRGSTWGSQQGAAKRSQEQQVRGWAAQGGLQGNQPCGSTGVQGAALGRKSGLDRPCPQDTQNTQGKGHRPCLSPWPGCCQAEGTSGTAQERPQAGGLGTVVIWSDTGKVTVTSVPEDKSDVQT